MLRTSSYTVYVDLPGSVDEMLLVHGYTGAYDKVSRKVATYVRWLDHAQPPKPLHGDWTAEPPVDGRVAVPAPETIALLRRRGYLTEKTPEEEQHLFSQLAMQLHASSRHATPAYIFMPTYDCNLRCSYCFQDHMRSDRAFSHLLRTMQRPMADRIFTAIPQIEASHSLMPPDGEAHRHITFFGGEPLLRASHDIVAYIMEKTLALGRADFKAVTNGTELDVYGDLLGPAGISFLQITLDGPRHEHDRRRIYPDGQGSFDVIAANIDMALARGTRVGLRMNVDRNNLSQLPELAEEFAVHGWDRHPLFTAYAAPIHAVNAKTDPKSAMGSWELDQALDRLREERPPVQAIRRPDDGMMTRVRKIFDRRSDPLPSFKASYCGAHDRMYIFDSFGDVYACWERTGNPAVRIGHIDEEGRAAMNAPQLEAWRSRTVTSNPVCLKCRYALYCGGGCAVLAEGASGKLTTNYCDGFAKRFRAATAEAYQQHLRGADVLSEEMVCDQ